MLRLFPVLVASLGLLALLGWLVGTPTLANLGASGVPMAPSTAVLFVAFGVALFLRIHRPLHRGASRTGMALSVVGTGIALLLLALSSWGILLDAEHAGLVLKHVSNVPPLGHMSTVTAACFLLVGLSYVATYWPGAARPWLALAVRWLTGLLLAIALYLALGYLAGGLVLYSTSFIPPAAPTSLAFLFLAISLLGVRGPRDGREPGAPEADEGTSILLVVVAALAAAGVASGGRLYYQSYARHFRAAAESEISAVAALKVSELTTWRAERIGDANAFFDNASFATLVRRWLDHPADRQAEGALRDWLGSIRKSYSYDRVSLLDARGIRRLSVPATREPLETAVQQQARYVQRSKQVTFVDFFREGPTRPIHLAVLAPILYGGDRRPIGAVVMRIDPEQYLFPFISKWPVPSRTAETLLIRRDGDDALFLNSLRFKADAALSLRVPLSRTDIPAVQAALGHEGVEEGHDYRGEQTVAAIRAVPNSPWSLVARMDVAEVYAPLQERMWVTVVVLGALLASATTTAAMLWRRQQRARRLAALEREVEQTRLLRLFFDLPFLGMARISPDARHFLQFNDRLCEIVGYSRKRLGSMRWMELVHPDDVEANLEARDRITHGESDGFTVDERLVRQDGETVFASVDIKCVRGADGAVEYLVVMVEDITERKHAEAQLQRTLGDLERSNRELEQFAYVASHDLQEPLRMVSSYTQLLAERYEAQLDDRAQKYIRYAVDGAHRMHALINDLLAYSRAGAADKPLEPTDTEAVLRAATHNLSALIIETRTKVSHDDLPTVAGTPQLALVFQNLIANAIKFRGTDVPRIHVSAQERPEEWLFSVKDNGIGIEPQHADRVFVIFQRLHTREEYPGTGIGLAVCQRIVERLGGKIWFESVPGTGTTFFFTIPKQPTTSTTDTAGTPS